MENDRTDFFVWMKVKVLRVQMKIAVITLDRAVVL